MSAELMTVLSLSADAALTVFGVASVLLVLWQDPRRRSNLYFALCMALFTLHGATSLPWRVVQHTDLDPESLLNLVSTFHVIGLVMSFSFVLLFAGLPRRTRWTERMISVPLMIVFLTLVWLGRVYTDFEAVAGGGYRHSVTPLGQVWGWIAVLYLSIILWIVRRHNPAQVRNFAVPLAALGLGALGFVSLSALREIPLNAVAVTLAIALLGRVVVKYQVFQPLADLNTELAARNIELIAASRQKSQFLANMSHELRTPLNSIIGYTELVGNGTYGTLTETQQDRLQKVTRNGSLLLALINDVLALSRIQAGRVEMNPKPVDTVALLDSLLAGFEARAEAKGLGLVRGYSRLPSLYVDEDTTREILQNIISNAIKLTETGVVILRGHYDDARHQVVISVTDTGPGIETDQQEQVFDVYLHSEDLLICQHEGTGLEMAIAYRLAELNSGRLWFESMVGQGTTFYLALPADEAHPKPARIIDPRRRTRGPVILAIDDDPEAIEVLQGQLGTARYRVYGAADPNEGLKLARELKPALITLDVLMPDIDGWQVLQTLRRDPATARIPVLVVSATDTGSRAKAAGADGFIRKPAATHALVEMVQQILAQAQARAETQELDRIQV